MFTSLFKHLFKTSRRRPSVPAPYRAQEIWWCALGEGEAGKKGKEQPVLVFRKFGSDTFWGLPLSSRTDEKNPPFYFLVSLNSKNQSAALSQMRVLHATNLVRRLGKISTKQFADLNLAVNQLLHETDPLRKVPTPSVRKSVSTSKYVIKRAPIAPAYSERMIPSPFPLYSLKTR